MRLGASHRMSRPSRPSASRTSRLNNTNTRDENSLDGEREAEDACDEGAVADPQPSKVLSRTVSTRFE